MFRECNEAFYSVRLISTILHGLDVKRFVEKYEKWSPVHTCLGLAWGTMTEKSVGMVAKKFAEDSSAILMEANFEVVSHLLFTTCPDSS